MCSRSRNRRSSITWATPTSRISPPEQLALSYPGRAWFDHGIVAAGSSDVPVVSADPFVNFRSAVTRLTQDGQRMGPEQGVTIDEAIRMFTINGAYASFEERIKGSITPGKLADLTVLDRDPRTVQPEELNTLRAEMTVIDGRVVLRALSGNRISESESNGTSAIGPARSMSAPIVCDIIERW